MIKKEEEGRKITKTDLLQTVRANFEEKLRQEGGNLSQLLTLLKRFLVLQSLPREFFTPEEARQRDYIFELLPGLAIHGSLDQLAAIWPMAHPSQIERLQKELLLFLERIRPSFAPSGGEGHQVEV